MCLACGGAGGIGSHGRALLEGGAVEFEWGGEADRVVLAAAVDASGGDCAADGLAIRYPFALVELSGGIDPARV
ncbi:hypothetical protein GCM10010272_66150 [Streptomyces lateritius]|nr:hypothetical protein GCM10010272_66150 [Streptomyces lateritius]